MTEENFDPNQCCLPLRSMEDMEYFMQEPPAWRTLCQPLTPHSTKIIKNIDLLHIPAKDIMLERPKTFCHYNPEHDNVVRHDEKSLPKTLVCHDMANGYHDDCFIDGSANYDNYMFYNWAAVDVFCYFSHYLLTVPPLGWINVAHAHGVKVIGTLITEWAEGAKFWEEVLQSEEQTQALVSYLVTIAKTLKFEGWLLNVENKVCAPAQLLRFVQALHRTLHAEVPHATLVWYDSVTVDGDLFWQNKLNHLNKPFFDACDGIFTNYSWSAEDVRQSAEAAGARRADVFVGIDVWGRNFYGGGMFNTQEAVRVAHAAACSLAVFAPAWTHEACGATHDAADPHAVLRGERLSHYERFQLRDLALWSSLWPFLNTRPPCQLPFKTSFCMGHGLKRRMYGEVLVNSPWYNLRHMQYQPNSIHGPHRFELTPGAAGRTGLAAARLPHRDTRGILKLRDSFVALKKEIRDLARRGGGHTPDENEQNSEGAAIAERETEEEIGSSMGRPNVWVKCKNVWRSITSKRKKEHAEGELSMEQPSVRISLRARGSGAGPCGAQLAVALAADEFACVAEHLDDSFSGGTCLQLSPPPPPATAARLLHTDFYIDDSLAVCVATKALPEFSDQYLALLLQGHQESDQGARLRFELVCHESAASPWAGAEAVVRPLAPPSQAFRALQVHLLLNQPDFYVPVENSFGWNVFYFVVHCPRVRITSVGARPARAHPPAPLLLGHLGLCAHAPSRSAGTQVAATEAATPTPHLIQEDR